MSERKTQTIDVSKKPLGRAATEIATVLIGKDDENYKPNRDTGAFVVVKNIDKMVLSGNKERDKEYYHHTGYPGGLKAVKYKRMMEKKPGATLKKAVYGMLPKNKLRVPRIKRLTIE